MGVEAHGNLSNNKSKNTFSEARPEYNKETNFKSERTNSFGIAVKPGITLGNTLFYLKAGIESANFKYSIFEESRGTTSVGSKNSRRIGFVPGIGVAFNVTDHIILGVEATHTFYKDAKIENVGVRRGNDIDALRRHPDGTTTNSNKFHSQATDVFARVSYKW